jgi:hypothetical protein
MDIRLNPLVDVSVLLIRRRHYRHRQLNRRQSPFPAVAGNSSTRPPLLLRPYTSAWEPQQRSMGSQPAAMFFTPSEQVAQTRTVAVVVLSPQPLANNVDTALNNVRKTRIHKKMTTHTEHQGSRTCFFSVMEDVAALKTQTASELRILTNLHSRICHCSTHLGVLV